MTTTNNRHADADTMPVSVERSDAIDAAAGLLLMARENRRAAKLRQNAGAHNAHHRAWLRSTADTYEAAAGRVQRACDEATRTDEPRSHLGYLRDGFRAAGDAGTLPS